MTTLPTVEALGRRPTPSGVPTVRAQATSAPTAATRAIAEAMRAEQEAHDTLRAEEAFNQLREKELDLTSGDNGFVHQQGRDVVDKPVMKDWVERFDTATNEISGGLANNDQRILFKQRAAVAALGYKQNLINHITQQRKVYETEVYQGGVAIETQAAQAAWLDDKAVGLSIARIESLVDTEAERKGWASDRTKAEKMAKVSDVHLGVINQAISARDSVYARAWYQKHKKDIDAGQWPAIEDSIHRLELTTTSQTATDEIMAQYTDERKALAAVREKYSGTMRDEVARRVKVRFADEERIKTDRRQELERTAWNMLTEKKTPDDLPPQMVQALGGKTVEQMWQFVERRDKVKTDYNVFDEFERRLEAGEITSRDQVREYDPFLSERDKRVAMKAFEKRGTISTTEMRAAYTDRVGKSKAKWSNREEEQWLVFQEYILDRVKETRRPEDIDVWADRWFMSGETTGNTLYTNDPDTFGEAVTAGRTEGFRYDIPPEIEDQVLMSMKAAGVPENTSEAYYTEYYLPAEDYLRAHDIPINHKSVAAAVALREAGKPVTPANIDKLMEQIP